MLATYNFSTITASEALTISAVDTVLMDTAPANQTTVLFLEGTSTMAGGFTVVAGGRSVTFGSSFEYATKTFPSGERLVIGSNSDDGPLSGGAFDDGMYGGAGNDTLRGQGGADLIQGNQGSDSLTGDSGDDVIYGGQGDDNIRTGENTQGVGRNFAQGNRGNDTITGSFTDSDTLLGGQGNDLIDAVGALFPPRPDFLNGNLGDDTITGGLGADTIYGEAGADVLIDSGGVGGLLDGGPGNDVLRAVTSTFDTSAQTTLRGGEGDDLVVYQNGTFSVSGGDGNDTIESTAENTFNILTADGGAGDDMIRGSSRSDSLVGGDGNDTLYGAFGSDTLLGGAGSDLFEVRRILDLTVSETRINQIHDWASEDRLYLIGRSVMGAGSQTNYREATANDYASAFALRSDLSDGFKTYLAVQVGNDVIVFGQQEIAGLDNGCVIQLVGRTLSDISATNFVG